MGEHGFTMIKILKRNKLFADIGLYLASTSINQAIPFLLLPVLTLYLTPKDYGYINNFSAILLILNAIIGGGLNINIMKHYYVSDDEYMKQLLGNLYFILLAATIVVLITVIIISCILDIKLIPKKIFVFIPCISFFFMSFEFQRTTLKMQKRALSLTVVTLFEVIFNVSLSLFLVAGLYFHWRGRVYGMSVSYIVFGLLSLGYFIKKKCIKFTLRKKILKNILKVAMPLFVSALGIIIIRKSGVLFIDSFSGKSEAGLYGIGLNLSMVMVFVTLAFLNVWIPRVYEKLNRAREEDKIILRNSIFVFTLIIFTLGFLLSFFSGLILRIMTTDTFYRARVYIPWFAFGFAFWAIREMYTPFFIHYGKQFYIAIIVIASAGLNLVLNYIAVHVIGSIGVAISFLVSNFVAYLSIFISVRTFCRLPVSVDFKSITLLIRRLKKS
jgi:O-antigen/teichoic acid export membrane protein